MTTKYQIVPETHGKCTSYKLQSMDQNQFAWSEFISSEPTLEALAAKARAFFGIDISTVPTLKDEVCTTTTTNFGTCKICNGPLDLDGLCLDPNCEGYHAETETSK